jgi:hypothetical protein
MRGKDRLSTIPTYTVFKDHSGNKSNKAKDVKVLSI